MKRTSRKLSEETKQKISIALRGKPKTEQHRQSLSAALIQYWATIPEEENEAEKQSLHFTTSKGDKTCKNARKIKANINE